MAFEQIEPFGDAHMDKRFKVLASWLVTFLSSSRAYQADEIKGISPELPALDESLDESLEVNDGAAGVSSADVLRDLAEQQLFM